MHLYFLVPLLACVLSCSLAFALLLRDAARASNRRSAQLFLCVALWSLGEVGWNLAPDPETALVFLRIAVPGIVLLGPVGLHSILEVADGEGKRTRRALKGFYAAAAATAGLAWTTPWVIEGMRPAPWGHAFETGPLFPLFFLYTGACGLASVRIWRRYTRVQPLFSERPGRGIVTVGMVLAIGTASLTDALLPIAGIQLPRLGSASFALLAGTIVWSSVNRGYLYASPAVFAQEMLRTLPDGIAMVNLEGEIRMANDGLARLLGVPAASLIGRGFAQFLPDFPLDPARRVLDVESQMRPGSGAALPVAVSTSPLDDPLGRTFGLVAVVRDLREVVGLRRRLVTSGRLAAVGQLAAGIAHEINNPLAFVRANLGVLREHWSVLEKALEGGSRSREAGEALLDGEDIIDESLEGIDRAAAIVRDVREFSHVGRSEREFADLNLLLARVIRVATTEARDRVRIEQDLSDLPHVWCSPQQLKQVFLNLVVNAIQAVGEGGRIRLRTAVEGSEVLVEVEDDGCGIPADALERIYDPFFTTKPVGEGTGLGLAISHEIVRNHQGQIEVASTPGAGTRFRVRLPVANGCDEAGG